MRQRAFGVRISSATRALPSEAYETRRTAAKMGLTHKEVKTEVKALRDVMRKRFKEALLSGVDYQVIRSLDVRRYKTAGKTSDAEDALKTVRQLWNALTQHGTVREIKDTQRVIDDKAFKTLKEKGYLPNEFPRDEYGLFKQFFNQVWDKYKESNYYLALQTYRENVMYGYEDKRIPAGELLEKYQKWKLEGERQAVKRELEKANRVTLTAEQLRGVMGVKRRGGSKRGKGGGNRTKKR